MEKKFLLFGLLFGGLAAVTGAFGAHVLKEVLNQVQQQSFETGIRYQMYHAFFMLFISTQPHLRTKLIFNLLLFGIVLFSFSIYLLNLREVLDANWLKFLGPITPIGGLLLISAWAIALFLTIKVKLK